MFPVDADHGPAAFKSRTASAFLAILTALTAATTASLAGPPPATATTESWGAIAVAPNGNIGFSADMDSPASAEALALANCAAPDCQVAVSYADTCGGVATTLDHRAWESALSDNRVDAKELVLAKCRERWGECVAFSRCSPVP